MTSPLVWENADRAELIHLLTGRAVPGEPRPQLTVADALLVVECLQRMDRQVLIAALDGGV